MTKNNTPTEFDDVTAELWQQDRHGERLEMIHRLNQIEEIIREQSGAVLGEDRQARLTQSIRDACGEIRELPDTIAEGEAERFKIPIHVCLVDFQKQSEAGMMPTLKAGIDEVLAMLDQYAARTPDYYGSGEAEKNQLHPADGHRAGSAPKRKLTTSEKKRKEWIDKAFRHIAMWRGQASDDNRHVTRSMRQLADVCEVSPSTVSRTLNPQDTMFHKLLKEEWDLYHKVAHLSATPDFGKDRKGKQLYQNH